MPLPDLFYRFNEKISRSEAIGCIGWLRFFLYFTLLFLRQFDGQFCANVSKNITYEKLTEQYQYDFLLN